MEISTHTHSLRLLKNEVFLFLCMSAAYMPIPYACRVHRGQKRASDLLELELHLICGPLSQCWGLNPYLLQERQALLTRVISPAPLLQDKN